MCGRTTPDHSCLVAEIQGVAGIRGRTTPDHSRGCVAEVEVVAVAEVEVVKHLTAMWRRSLREGGT